MKKLAQPTGKNTSSPVVGGFGNWLQFGPEKLYKVISVSEDSTEAVLSFLDNSSEIIKVKFRKGDWFLVKETTKGSKVKSEYYIISMIFSN